jgi:hypothetical protein
MHARWPDHGPISNAMEVAHTTCSAAMCMHRYLDYMPMQYLKPRSGQHCEANVATCSSRRVTLASSIFKLEATSNHCFFWPASPHFVYLNLFMGGKDELQHDDEKGKA